MTEVQPQITQLSNINNNGRTWADLVVMMAYGVAIVESCLYGCLDQLWVHLSSYLGSLKEPKQMQGYSWSSMDRGD
jgi:hypothetical protein